MATKNNPKNKGTSGGKKMYEGKEVKVLGLNIINDLVKIDNNGAVIFVDLNEVEFNKKNS